VDLRAAQLCGPGVRVLHPHLLCRFAFRVLGVGSGVWLLGVGFWVLGFGFWYLGFQGSGLQVPGSWLRVESVVPHHERIQLQRCDELHLLPGLGFRFKNNCFTVLISGSEEDSYLRLIDGCITQL